MRNDSIFFSRLLLVRHGVLGSAILFMLIFHFVGFPLFSETPPVKIKVKISFELGARRVIVEDGLGKKKATCEPVTELRICILGGGTIDIGDGRVIETTYDIDKQKLKFDFTDPLPSHLRTDTFYVDEDTPLSEGLSQLYGVSKQIYISKGSYPVDFTKNVFGTVDFSVGLNKTSTLITCNIIQDINFASVTTYPNSSDINATSSPWKPGVGSPQYSPSGGCDNTAGYTLMWGNNVVGESIRQDLGSGGVKKGQRYDLSFCARLRPSQNNLVPDHVRVRVIAYNSTLPSRGILPIDATVIYETPTITSNVWQTFTSCSWIADKDYTKIEILPVNNSSLNNGAFVSWSDVDNVRMCQVNQCDGLNFKISPNQKTPGQCCYNVDLSITSCITNLKGVRIKTPAGITLQSATAPTLWSQSGLTSSETVWNAPTTTLPITSTGGSLCFTAANSVPFFITIEWLDNQNNVFCRTERKVSCPPPCMEIEKIKSMSCIGYNNLGYPEYKYCIEIVNNGVQQTALVQTNAGIMSPSSFTIPSGIGTICGTFTANSATPPANVQFMVAVNGCKDSIIVKLPNDCPPKQCMEIERFSLKCLATNQQGNTTYEYSWLLTNTSGVLPSTITVTSNGGQETTYNNVSLASEYKGTLQYATALKDSVCVTFTLRNSEKAIICIKTLCLSAPKCSNCCDNFYKRIKLNSVKSTGVNTNGDNISMNMTFAPNRPIRSMTATVVSASRRRIAPFTSAWERIYGDIGGAVVISTPVGPGLRYYGGISPSTSFIASTQKTREVEWGINYSGTTGIFNTTIGLLFPEPYTGGFTKNNLDELDYFLRISMTDINCIRCDTLIHVTMRRSSSPWNTITNNSVITRGEKESKADKVLSSENNSENDAPLSLIMKSKENGTLKLSLPINNSTSAEEKISVIGIGFIPNPIIDIKEFSPLTSNFTYVPNNDTLFCTGLLKEGESASFNLVFNNPPFVRWNNTVIIKYKVGTDSDTLTDYVDIIAAIPVETMGGDLVEETIDLTVKPRTYALSFTNSNKSKLPIASIEIRLPKDISLLAIGSGLGDTIRFETVANFIDDTTKDQNFIVPYNNSTRHKTTLNEGEVVKPIYMTVSGGSSGFDCDFITRNEDEVILSEGKIKLTKPLSIQQSDNAKTGLLNAINMDVYPNPASVRHITLNLVVQASEVVTITINDINGKELIIVTENNILSPGNSAFIIDTEVLASGNYLITTKTRKGEIFSTYLNVVR